MDQPPVHLHALSYDTSSPSSWRPVVKIVGWACVGWGGFTALGALGGIVEEIHQGMSLRFWLRGSDWSWRLPMALDLLCSPVLIVGGFLALRFRPAAGGWIIAGAVILGSIDVLQTILQSWSLPGQIASWQLEAAISVSYLVVSLILPALVIALITRPAMRQALDRT